MARCITEGLVGGTTFASDASLIRADASKQNAPPKERWDAALIGTEIARGRCSNVSTCWTTRPSGRRDVAPQLNAYSDPA